MVWLSEDCETPSLAAALGKLCSRPTPGNANRSSRCPRAISIMPGAGLNFDNQPQRARLFISCRIGGPMITRRHLLSAAGGLVAFSATPVVAAEAEPRIGFMEIKRIGSQPSGKGSADYFTGTVRIDPLFQ